MRSMLIFLLLTFNIVTSRQDDKSSQENYQHFEKMLQEQARLLHKALEHVIYADQLVDRESMEDLGNDQNSFMNLFEETARLPLIRQLRTRDLTTMSTLLKSGINVNDADPTYGFTALHMAVSGGEFAAVKFLIEHGANVNLPSKNGISPLHIACGSHEVLHLQIAKLLVKNGANINARTKYGVTPLMIAATIGNENVVRYLLKLGAELYHNHKDGWNVMHGAIGHRHVRIVRMLINAGFDLNTVDGAGLKPLDVAVWKNDSEISEFLIDAAINDLVRLNDKDRDMNPLVIAVGQNRSDIVKSFLKFKAKVNVNQRYRNSTLLHLAVMRNFSHIVQLLLDAGSDPNMKNSDGVSPLHIAVANNRLDICKLLINAGADVHTKNNCETTPLFMAIRASDLDIVRLLIDSKADVKTGNVLHDAVMMNRTDVVKLLLDIGNDPNMKDSDGDSPLHLAVANNRLDICRLLINVGADVNTKNNHEIPPLFMAVVASNLDIVKLLIDSKADVKTGNVLILAIMMSHIDVVKLLLDAGSDPNGRFHDIVSPLQLAVINNKANIGKLLIDAGANVNAKIDRGIPVLQYTLVISSRHFQRHVDSKADAKRGNVYHSALKRQINEVVKLLLDAEIQPDGIYLEGVSPLHFAVIHNRVDIGKQLIDAGANVNQKDSVGLTPLMIAQALNNWEFANYLQQSKAGVHQTGNKEQAARHIALHVRITKFLSKIGTESSDKAATADITPRHKTPTTTETDAVHRLVKEADHERRRKRRQEL